MTAVLATAVFAVSQMYRIAVVSLATAPRPVQMHVVYAPAGGTPTLYQPSAVPAAAATPEPPPRSAPVHGRVGEKRTFWVQYVDALRPGPPRWSQTQATLAYSTEHADIWVDDDIDGLMDARMEKAQREAEMAYLSQDDLFGSLSYTNVDVAHHLKVPACDRNGNRVGAVPAFVPSRGELLNELILAPGKTRNGYADENSYNYQAFENCIHYHSNELPALMVIPMPDGGDDPGDAQLLADPAHELQHLKNYVRHKIRGSSTRGPMPMLNEGLSVLAQDFAVQSVSKARHDIVADSWAREYLLNSNAVSLPAFYYNDGTEQHPSGGACYGGAYLLQRYLYEHYGDAYLQRATDTQLDGVEAIAAALPIPFPDAMRGFGNWVLEWTQKITLQPLPDDFTVLGGSVTLFETDRPVANIKTRDGRVVFAQILAQ